MPTFEISFVDAAQDDLAWFGASERTRIYHAALRLLKTDATMESNKRKRLRPNPIAPWELRLGKYRVFYEVVGGNVRILAVGFKEHNDLFLRGERVEL